MKFYIYFIFLNLSSDSDLSSDGDMSEADEEDYLNNMGESENIVGFHGNIRLKSKLAEKRRLTDYHVTHKLLKQDLDSSWLFEENEICDNLSAGEEKLLASASSFTKLRIFYATLNRKYPGELPFARHSHGIFDFSLRLLQVNIFFLIMIQLLISF